MNSNSIPYNSDNLEAGFRKYLEGNSYSRTSVNNYLADIRTFLKWFSQDLHAQRLTFDIATVSEKVVTRYCDFLRIAKTPVQNINRSLSSIRTFGKYLATKGLVKSNPAEKVRNIKQTHREALVFWLRMNIYQIIAFIVGFGLVALLFVVPAIVTSAFQTGILDQQESPDTLNLNMLPEGVSASTSAELLTIPIIDQAGALNLTSAYPKIVGSVGVLSIEAPELSLSAQDTGNLKLQTREGSIHFLFEGAKPSLPYESAFYFSAENLQSGSLIYGELGTESKNVSLLELSSGSPTETKFRVDGEGNVYIQGNIILEGNLIMNPDSIIFGSYSDDTATSSASR